jgi:hypothetical protein
MDKDYTKEDDCIGEVRIPLLNVCSTGGNVEDRWYDIQPLHGVPIKDGELGRIHIRLEFSPRKSVKLQSSQLENGEGESIFMETAPDVRSNGRIVFTIIIGIDLFDG